MAPLGSLHAALAFMLLTAVTQAPVPPRDASVSSPGRSGTGLVAGVVTLGDPDRTPVRRAVVELVAVERVETFAAISDDHGRFVIERLPAGRFTLRATKPAHIPVTYGARRSGGAGTLLVIRDGERMADIPLVLPRGAVLAGRITLPNGQPLANVEVIGVPSKLITAGGNPPAGARVFRTNDLGQFRLFGLHPGDYVVVCLPTFARGDIARMTDREVTDLFRQLQQPAAPGVSSASGSLVTFAPTYYPGTPSVGEATLIRVAAGELRENIEFSIAAFPSAAIRGRVVGIDGTPTRAFTLSIEAVGPPLPIAAVAMPRIERPGPDGSFQVLGVPPGQYRLRARAGGVIVSAAGDMLQTVPEVQTQSATVEVSMAGIDLAGVFMTLREGQRMSGRVTIDSADVPGSWTGATITLQPLASRTNGSTAGVPGRAGLVDADGRFAVTGLEPVEYEIGITLPASLRSDGWAVGAVRHNNREVRDRPIVFDQESLTDVEVRLTRVVTELVGNLVSESGAPAADYFVVVFPADRTVWHAASPRIRITRPAADGSFNLSGLLAGTYRLAALTDIESGEEKDASFLDAIYSASIEVTVRHGASTRQDLRIKATSKE